MLLVGAIYGLAFFPSRTTFSFLLGILLMEGLSVVLKHGARAAMGRNHPLGARPSRPDGGCGVFYTPGKVGSQSYGMPSGHSGAISFAAAFWILYLVQSHQQVVDERTDDSDSRMARALTLGSRIVLIVSVALMVVASRVLVGCHTVPQVVTGSFVGALFGWGIFELRTVVPQK